MKRNLSILLLTFFGFVSSRPLKAQENDFAAKSYESTYNAGTANLNKITSKEKITRSDWEQYNADFAGHPDKNFLSPYAPPNSESLIEVLEKRTATSAYFLDSNDPGKVISQGSLGNMHYQKNGAWLALDYRLDKVNKDVYEASHQPVQVGFNTSGKFAYFNEEGKKLKFNQWILTGEQNGQKTELAKADWSDYTIGDDGIRIHNIFPGIDAEMTVRYGKIKTNFIVNSNQYSTYETLFFTDKFEYSKGEFQFDFKDNPTDNIGDIQLKHRGNVISEISKAVMYAQAHSEEVLDLVYLPEDKILSIKVSVAELNNLLQYGKVIIDPLVSGNPATLNQLGVHINSSHYTANCSGTAFNTACSYNWNVPVPAGISITRKYFSAFARTHAPCVNGNVVFFYRYYSPTASAYLNYTFAADPLAPDYNTQGTAYMTNADVNVTPSWFPRSCSVQNLLIELNILRRCPVATAPTNCGNDCIAGEGPFVVSVEGRTVEIGATTVNNASSVNICAGQQVTLATTASYGVPPITALWTPGNFGGSPVYINPTATTTYKAVVTDACNNKDSATVTVNVTPTPPTPAVTISANPGNAICTGTSVTFTAVATNAGTPAYQWRLNGNPVGTNSTTYTNASLTNGAVITCDITPNVAGACANNAVRTSNAITMIVTPPLTPSLSIATANTTICQGVNTTFTATPTNGGVNPSYQWKVNGNNVGTNSTTFSSTTLNNNDVISCVMTVGAGCISPGTVTSNSLTMTVNPTVVPTLSISANPGNVICAGTSVTFTATATNVTNPVYQWRLNGNPVGTNSTTYTNATLANGNTITCEVTSAYSCAIPNPRVSNTITMTVSPVVTPTLSISANPGNTICAGTSVTFTATAGNVTNPVYQWRLNGNPVGTNSTTYTNAALANGNTITCEVTSAYSCAIPNPRVSNTIMMTVSPVVTPTLSISANPGNTICVGTSVTFTATATNVTNPVYQWRLNGNPVGTNSPTYTNAALANGNTITCEVTSAYSCAIPNPRVSNTITMTVSPVVTPTLSISANLGNTICAGTSVTFTATAGNVTNPVYQWRLNGNPVGTNSTTYTNAALANGNTITCEVTSAYSCASPNPAVSNTVTMTVNPVVTPTLSISANPGNTICAGTSVTFTATAGNVTNPVYQWRLNGNPVGTNSPTYTNAALANGNTITCQVTSAYVCALPASVNSNTITMTVNPIVIPAISISTANNLTFCQGTSITFNATAGNVTNPAYQWRVNGLNAGTNSTTFTTSALNNGDVITCQVTSTYTCAVPNPVLSNSITVTVLPNLTPGIIITPLPNDTVCEGTPVSFISNVTNVSNPTYQWTLNGNNTGTATTYNLANPNNNDVIVCTVTTDYMCATSSTAQSNVITMHVKPTVYPAVSITAIPDDELCLGDFITVNATITGGGNTPSIQWYKNSIPVGTNSPSYAESGFLNNNTLSVTIVSNEECAITTPVTSNAITFTVHNPVFTTDSIKICRTEMPYSWNGFMIDTFGTNLATFYTSSVITGCDSTVTLNLYTEPLPTIINISEADCGRLEFEDKLYGSSTSFTDTLKSDFGCDSVIRFIELTVHPEYVRRQTLNLIGCNLLNFEGNVYNSSVSFNDTLTTTFGCDSVYREVNIEIEEFELSLALTPEEPYVHETITLTTSANIEPYIINYWLPQGWFKNQQAFVQSIQVLNDTMITVSATSEKGCIDTAKIDLKLLPLDQFVFVPNAFSPNGDGLNDYFLPRFVIERGYRIATFRIFDRYGTRIYTGTLDTYHKGWDGTYGNGQPATVGTYFYDIYIEFVNGEKYHTKGDITLIR